MPVFALDRYEAVQIRRLAREDVEQQTLRLTGIAADEQRQLSEGARQLLVALAQLPQVRGLDPAECNPLFQSLLQQYPIYANLGVVSVNGDTICSGIRLTAPSSARDRPWFQRAINDRMFAAGEYQIGRVTGEPTVNFGYPVLDADSHVIAVTFTAMRLTWLERFVAEADLPPGSVLTAFDREGTVLARYPTVPGTIGSSIRESPLFAAATSQQEGTLQLTDEAEAARFFGFAPLSRGPEGARAYVALGIERGAAFSQANDLERTRRIIRLVAFLVLILVVMGAERYVRRPVWALLAATRRFSAGDLTARSGLPHSGGELGQLAQAFDEMAESRQAAEERIERFNRSLQRRVDNRTRALTVAMDAVKREHATVTSVLASMSDGLVVMDSDARIRYCNARAGELLAFDPTAAEGKTVEEALDLVRAGFADPDEAVAAWRDAFGKPAALPSFEVELVGPPLRDVHVQVFEVSQDEGDSVGSGALLHDVTGERELNRVKDELVSVVSHELRTPLASLVGFANLLLTREVGEEQRRQYLSIIADEGHRLTALINDFLDLQRMESGHTEIATTPVEPRPLLERAIASAGDGLHTFHLDLQHKLPLVHADAAKVQQVLANLLSNACKYAPDAPDVTIRTKVMDGQIKFSIEDQGLGLPPEALPHLFEKFFRVDNSDRRKIKGTGLGLAISKQIIAAHGGRIWAESDGLGKGTRLNFTLPLAVEVRMGGDVLIVEDDVGFAQLVEAELLSEGLTATIAGSGELALERVAKEGARAIVLDLVLPGIGGEEFLNRLSRGVLSQIPVVVMTVKDLTAEERERLTSVGANSFVQKGPASATVAAKTVALTLSPASGREERAA